jgi:predicted enzyme related to lactoylglutathione lyase
VAASKFYAAVFGWTFSDPRPEYPKEKLQKFDFNPSVRLGGGIQKSPDETGIMSPGRGGVCVYWFVEDVEKTAVLIEKAGGKMLTNVVKESDSGLYRLFEDTEGNLGGAYQFIGSK